MKPCPTPLDYYHSKYVEDTISAKQGVVMEIGVPPIRFHVTSISRSDFTVRLECHVHLDVTSKWSVAIWKIYENIYMRIVAKGYDTQVFQTSVSPQKTHEDRNPSHSKNSRNSAVLR